MARLSIRVDFYWPEVSAGFLGAQKLSLHFLYCPRVNAGSEIVLVFLSRLSDSEDFLAFG